MIEIELKFKLSREEESHLLENATLVAEEEFEDVYYDTSAYDLTTNDIWLRSRNNVFLVKVPLLINNSVLAHQANTFRKEISDEQKIRELLSIQPGTSLEQDLENAGIVPIYRFTTRRRKFEKDGFTIDVDTAHFDDFSYQICEIEMIVDSQDKAEETLGKIQEFAQQHGLAIEPVRGKLIEYMYRKNQEHYNKLKWNR